MCVLGQIGICEGVGLSVRKNGGRGVRRVLKMWGRGVFALGQTRLCVGVRMSVSKE